MPTPAASSSSVFSRFRRQHDLKSGTKGGEQEEVQHAQRARYSLQAENGRSSLSPVPPVEDKFDEEGSKEYSKEEERPLRRLKAHRRESSLLSVTDFRRSVSLRSHRSQLSGGSGGTRHRNQSAGNLLHLPQQQQQQQPLSPTLASSISTSTSPPPPSPVRHRSKLSLSARPFSRSLKSTDALSTFSPDPSGPVPDVPSLTAVDHAKKPISMLAVAPLKRQVTEKQAFASQVSLARDAPPSQHGSDGASSLLPPPPMSSSGQTPHAIFQQIQETAAKRMATIQYLKRIHEGDVYFFNTLHFTQTSLSSLPSLHSQKLGRRATGYFLLGYSLPVSLDLSPSSPLEYLKPLTALLQEFETYQNLAGMEHSSSLSRGRVGQMFKTGMGLGKSGGKARRASTATDTFGESPLLGVPLSANSASAYQDMPSPIHTVGYDFTHLQTPHLPFDPDFSMAFSTLCESLLDMYSNLLNLISGPEVCGPAVAEAFSKADKSIRKILVSNVVKEFEDHTRNGAKAEMAGLSKLVLGGLM